MPSAKLVLCVIISDICNIYNVYTRGLFFGLGFFMVLSCSFTHKTLKCTVMYTGPLGWHKEGRGSRSGLRKIARETSDDERPQLSTVPNKDPRHSTGRFGGGLSTAYVWRHLLQSAAYIWTNTERTTTRGSKCQDNMGRITTPCFRT